jgi:transcriptional regulator with XRE-family HTH domain
MLEARRRSSCTPKLQGVTTPLGDFIRAKRDSTAPEGLGLPATGRRRVPGLRRAELATRAGISVEYLTRIEQGQDRNPSGAVVKVIGDALNLDAAERRHLGYLSKIAGGACRGQHELAPPRREVRARVLETLRLLEPGVAAVTNRLGDLLAYTSGFEMLMKVAGLLDDRSEANLTRWLFTDPRARIVFPDWDQVADEQVFNMWLGPSAASSEWFKAELAPVAGVEFTRRAGLQLPPPQRPLRMRLPTGEGVLVWNRETLELPDTDAQQIVVFLPADDHTAVALARLRQRSFQPYLRAL